MTAAPERPLPYDPEAETALLGSCMLSRGAVQTALDLGITTGDFYVTWNAQVWQAITAVFDTGAYADPVTISAALNGAGGDGTITRLRDLEANTPASANALAYARIIADLSRRRQIIGYAYSIGEAAREGADVSQAVAHLTIASAPVNLHLRVEGGGTFALDVPDTVPAIWGEHDRVLWAEGEELLLVGPPGVGKTTLATQLVGATVGVINSHLLDLPVARANRVLYLACDRPAQIRRAFKRCFGQEQYRQLLTEKLVIWKGPPTRDFAKAPETLWGMCREYEADYVFIDSLKDVAIGISDDEVGAGLNSAIQLALSEGVQVCALHHQRKGQAGSKPKELADVYGSTWVTAGAGSVVLLWGQAGDPLIDLIHLKQPAAEVGPISIDHDHNTGRTNINRGDVDPLRILRNNPNGLTSTDLAIIVTGKDKPSENERLKAQRNLDKLVSRKLAHRIDGRKNTAGEASPIPHRYHATVPEPDNQPQPAEPTLDDEEPF